MSCTDVTKQSVKLPVNSIQGHLQLPAIIHDLAVLENVALGSLTHKESPYTMNVRKVA